MRILSPSALRPEKSFSFALGANHGDPGVLHLILRVVQAALVEFQRADGEDVGIIAGNAEIERPCLVLDIGLLGGFGSDLGDLEEYLW